MQLAFLFLTFVTIVVAQAIPPAQGERNSPATPLQAEFQKLAAGFKGRVGICAQDAHQTACINQDQRFSLQSVIKLMVGAAVMEASEKGSINLDERIVVHKKDLSLYVQPIAKLVTASGYPTTARDLIRRAIVDSDSAATDILIAKLGGPHQVQAFLDRKSVTGLRVDRDERHLQTEIVGLEWRQEFVDPDTLTKAIAAVPESRRDAAFKKYKTDPRDTATPKGMSSFLYRLAHGELLSPTSTAFILKVMTETVTFPDRLKAGTPAGWTLGHKTGTGGNWKGLTVATNDVGVMTAPNGAHVAIVVLIGDTTEPPEKRAALMASAARLSASHLGRK